MPPGDPPPPLGRDDAFVDADGAVGIAPVLGALDNGRPEGLADEARGRLADKGGEGAVGEGDGAVAVAPDDEVALCVDEPAMALLALGELEDAIGELFDALLEQRGLALEGAPGLGEMEQSGRGSDAERRQSSGQQGETVHQMPPRSGQNQSDRKQTGLTAGYSPAGRAAG